MSVPCLLQKTPGEVDHKECVIALRVFYNKFPKTVHSKRACDMGDPFVERVESGSHSDLVKGHTMTLDEVEGELTVTHQRVFVVPAPRRLPDVHGINS